jgi:hypothetical protein
MLPKGGIGAEIGVWKGDFSAQILEIAQPKCLHLIDPWQSRDDESHARAWYGTARGIDMEGVFKGVMTRFQSEIRAKSVDVHRMSAKEAMISLKDIVLDFVYVDGDHAYDAVRYDLDVCFAKVRAGGLICVDDHMRGKWWGDGVIRAVNEFLGAHPRGLELKFMANSQVVIAKR